MSVRQQYCPESQSFCATNCRDWKDDKCGLVTRQERLVLAVEKLVERLENLSLILDSAKR